MKRNRRKLCCGNLLVRSTVVSALVLVIAQTSLAGDAVPHIECAITEECKDGTCSPIEPTPLFFRFVRFPDQLVAWVYGSSRVIGGPEQDLSQVFRYKIKDGRTMLLTEGKHGRGDDHIWFDLFAPDDSRQRSFVLDTVLREHEGHCITRIEIQPGRPAAPDRPPVNGLGGECRWTQSLCSPTEGDS